MLFNRADIMDAAARHIAPASPATPGTASGGVYFPLTLIRYDSGGGGFTTPDRHGRETPAQSTGPASLRLPPGTASRFTAR